MKVALLLLPYDDSNDIRRKTWNASFGNSSVVEEDIVYCGPNA
jgi:hypothetical protein